MNPASPTLNAASPTLNGLEKLSLEELLEVENTPVAINASSSRANGIANASSTGNEKAACKKTNEKVENPVWPPTSLKIECGNPYVVFDVAMVRRSLIEKFLETLKLYKSTGGDGKGYAQFKSRVEEILLYNQSKILFCPMGRENASRVGGILTGLDNEGWLKIQKEDGTTEKYCSGELAPLAK